MLPKYRQNIGLIWICLNTDKCTLVVNSSFVKRTLFCWYIFPPKNTSLLLITQYTYKKLSPPPLTTLSFIDISSTFLQWLLRSSYHDTLFIKIKYFPLVTTKNDSGKLPFPCNRSSPKSKGLEYSTTQAHLYKLVDSV